MNNTELAGNRPPPLLDRVAAAEARLEEKLLRLDLKSLHISDYNQRYLGGYLTRLKSTLQLYGRLIRLSLDGLTIRPEDVVWLDYGGGSGLLSCLASETGLGTVLYNDLYDVSCADVGRLSEALGLKLDHIICGDVEDVAAYLRRHSISIQAIVSYDVLEHIYDVASHFCALKRLQDAPFRMIYASGANIANPRYVYSVKKKQIEAEYRDRERIWGHKERDCLQAFLEVRKKMIAACAPDLDGGHVEQLARATRGLIQRDIETCVAEFRRRGSISYRIEHPTNTCDPYTGNWCEHLMEFDWLERTLREEGIAAEIQPGRYGRAGSRLSRSVKACLDATMGFLGKRGMFLAPYYVVCADVTPPAKAL